MAAPNLSEIGVVRLCLPLRLYFVFHLDLPCTASRAGSAPRRLHCASSPPPPMALSPLCVCLRADRRAAVSLQVEDIDGNDFDLASLQGSVVAVVNVASA